MTSVEFWTGYVTGKAHEDDWYQTPYCCATDKDGNCTSTCYTDHYTREWYLGCLLGSSGEQRIVTSSIDTQIQFVRDGFDADQDWLDAYEGEACSVTNTYINYVSAAESSLHHREGTDKQWEKTGLLPGYPQIHGKYHLHRVHDLGVGVPNLTAWRENLNDYMKILGALKQINLFVYFVPTTDAGYKNALEAHWRGANKNDTIIIIGAEKGTKDIGMVEVITWARSDIYRNTLIDEIMKVGTLDENTSEPVLKLVNDATLKLYERRPMKEYEHLAKEIEPPMWIMVILIIIAIPGSLLMAYVFHHIDLDEIIRERFGRGGFRRSRGIRIGRRRY